MPVKIKHRRHRITIEFRDNVMEFLIPWSDLKQDLSFDRKVIDAHNGTPGKVGECMDFQCFRRLQQQFPFPVHYVEVTYDRVWLVNKVDRHGIPKHALRAICPTVDREDKRAFDVPGAKKKILAGKTDVVIERPIRLLAPRASHKRKNTWGNVAHTNTRDGSRKKTAVRVGGTPGHHGAIARAIRAGLLKLQPA